MQKGIPGLGSVGYTEVLSHRSKQRDQSMKKEHRGRCDTNKGMGRGFAKAALHFIFLYGF